MKYEGINNDTRKQYFTIKKFGSEACYKLEGDDLVYKGSYLMKVSIP